MTKFQALYVLWLRHETLQSCSWRALAGHYYNRYNGDGDVKPMDERVTFHGLTYGGNQIIGMDLEQEAFEMLVPDRLFREPPDLYENDLTRIHPKFNIKNHIK